MSRELFGTTVLFLVMSYLENGQSYEQHPMVNVVLTKNRYSTDGGTIIDKQGYKFGHNHSLFEPFIPKLKAQNAIYTLKCNCG